MTHTALHLSRRSLPRSSTRLAVALTVLAYASAVNANPEPRIQVSDRTNAAPHDIRHMPEVGPTLGSLETQASESAESEPTGEPIAPASADGSVSDMDLGELDRKLNNPLTDIWSLTFQNNTGWLDGDDLDGTENTNLLFFQPFLPFEIGENKETMFTLRPVFPLVTQPVFEDPNQARSSGHETGFGDLQLLTLIGPNSGKGLVWGAGFTMKFPTATEDVLGQGKWQAGPAGMVFYMGNPWVAGILAQHWTSFRGDSDRPDARQTDIQYILRRSIPGAMSIGMGPTISIDWEADSGEKVTLPVGLGITKTTRWGKTPVKLRAELHYSVVRPDAVGTEWNFRLQITPIIDNPFK